MGRPMPKTMRYSGSGVVLNNKGDVLTANHVINEKTIISLIGEDTKGKRFGCRVLAKDDSRDLALLRCDGLIGVDGIRGLAPLSLPIGTRAVAAGFPSGGPFIISDGIIANVLPEKGKYMMSIPSGPGMSGGAVFTYDGLLIGIIQAGYVKPPFTLFTTSNLQLRKFLKEHGYGND